MAENTMPEANQVNQTNQPQKKGKGWLWAILGCGGCLFIVGIIIVILLVIGAMGSTWKDYNYPLGKFSVSFPQSPKTETSAINVGGSSISLTQYSAEDRFGGYLVQYAILPEITDVSEPNKLLESSLQGQVSTKPGSKVVSSNFKTFSGNPAQEFLIQLPDNTYVKGINILVGKSLYSVVTASKDQNPKDYQKFIDSFKLQ